MTVSGRGSSRDEGNAATLREGRYRAMLEDAERELHLTAAKLRCEAKTHRHVPLDSSIRDLDHLVDRITDLLAAENYTVALTTGGDDGKP